MYQIAFNFGTGEKLAMQGNKSIINPNICWNEEL